MIQVIKKYLGLAPKTEYNSEFSDFMRNAKAAERKKVFLKAARMATEDQKRMIKKASAM